MPWKPYTHAKGFNITSLRGKAGLYFFRDKKGKLLYIGMCNGDFKNRINAHGYGEFGKLSYDVHFLTVLIADPAIYPLYVLEHLLIYVFFPPRNDASWLFCGNEDNIVQIAKDKNLIINGSVKDFLLSFESVVIEREWEDVSAKKYKRYGEEEQLSSKKVDCNGKRSCLCFNCLVERQSWLLKRRRSNTRQKLK
jgi:hypothetical protein